MFLLPYLALTVGYGPPDAKTTDKSVQNVPVMALLVANTDGVLPVKMTPDEIKKWIDDANAIYKPAKIHFEFKGDDTDCVTFNNSYVNYLLGPENADWEKSVDLANLAASRSPDRITLLFRHGPGIVATSRSFTGLDYNFIALPAFEQAGICDHLDIHALSRQLGAYLGLKPTYARDFPNVNEAAQYLKDHAGDPNCFDGDGISDTPPDPYIVSPDYQCQPMSPVVLNETDFAPPLDNLMSLYDTPGKSLSPIQIKWAQWAMQTRLKNKMAMPTNRTAQNPRKADRLEILTRKDASATVQTLAAKRGAAWNGDSHLLFRAKKGGSVTFQLAIEEDGAYQLDLYATQAPDFGIVQVFLDEKPLDKPQDFWAPYVYPTGRLDFGAHNWKKGTYKLRLEVTDKNKLSTDYHFALDCVDITPVEKTP